MSLIKVAKASDIKPGEGRVVYADDVPIALFNDNGQFFALDNECPHRKGPLGEGMLDGDVVTCPWHGWRFNIKDGKNVGMPINVKAYSVKVDNGDIYVDV